MTIDKISTDDEVILKLNGWLDTQSSEQFHEAIDSLDEDGKKLVLELSELEYISSAGIRLLVYAHKKTGGNLSLKNVQSSVMDVLSATGITKKLKIE